MLISFIPQLALAQSTIFIATTTVDLSVCGDFLVNGAEQCDVPGETGSYSTTIVGRQCTPTCAYGPYCGDGILQSLFGEECDDGNNDDSDFCSAECTIEPAGSGGGGSSGGGGGTSGGSNVPLGDTQVSMEGLGYPNQTVHILLDAKEVGTIRANSSGSFDFAVNASPGSASLGFWSNDQFNTKSATYNTSFDVTQGAITTVRGILLPPTISADKTQLNPGETVVLRGQTAPDRTMQLYVNNQLRQSVQSNSQGVWQISLNTSGFTPAEYGLKVRTLTGTAPLLRESSFSSVLNLAVGVNGSATRPSDLNRDGSINLIDFSILIFWWQTNGGNSNPPADINRNGNVGLEDFSILLFNWTG